MTAADEAEIGAQLDGLEHAHMSPIEQLYAELRSTRLVQAAATDAHARAKLEGECEYLSEAIEHELRVQEIERKWRRTAPVRLVQR